MPNLSPAPVIFIPRGSVFALLSQCETHTYFWQAYWHKLNIVPGSKQCTEELRVLLSGAQTFQKSACFSSIELTTSPARCQPRFVDVSHNPNFSAASSLFCLHYSLNSNSFTVFSAAIYLHALSAAASVLSLLASHFLKGWRVITLIPLLPASEISNKQTWMLKAVAVQPQEPRGAEAAAWPLPRHFPSGPPCVKQQHDPPYSGTPH